MTTHRQKMGDLMGGAANRRICTCLSKSHNKAEMLRLVGQSPERGGQDDQEINGNRITQRRQ